MKYVAMALLLANVGYFVWQAFFTVRETPAETPLPRRDASVESLVLLSERPRVPARVVPAPPAPAEEEDVTGGSEREGRTDERDREEVLSDVITNAVAPEPRGPIGCPAIGPFTDVFTAESVLEQTLALDLPADLRAVDENLVATEYRVMIPPAASIEEAFRKLRELQSLDIDSYILTRGDAAMGISLGVFSRRDAAEQVRQERLRQGYEAEITEIPRFERQFWVVGRQPAAPGARLDLWARFAEADAEVRLDTLPCAEQENGQEG